LFAVFFLFSFFVYLTRFFVLVKVTILQIINTSQLQYYQGVNIACTYVAHMQGPSDYSA